MVRKLDRTAAALAGAMIVVRAISLVGRPLWFDEIFTEWISRQSLTKIVQHLRLDSGPPLFYALSLPFVRAGERLHFDPAARLLSFGALALLFVAFGPRYSGGRRFAVLLASSPLIFFYSGEARPYALLSAVSFALFLAAVRAPDTRRSRVVAALSAAVLPWIHYLGLFVVAGSVILCAIRKRWGLAALQAAAASLFLAWLPVAIDQPPLSIAWNFSSDSPALRAPQAFGFWGGLPAYFSAWRPPAAWAGIALGFAILLAALAAARKSSAVRGALAFSLLPLALVAAANFFRPVYFPGRTEMATLPVALWAFARASRRSAAVNLLTLVAAGAGLAGIAFSVLSPAGPFPYSETAKFLAARSKPGDLLVAADANYLPLRLKRDRGEVRARLIGLPEEIESHPGWFEPSPASRIDAEQARIRQEIAAVPAGGRIDFAIPPDAALRDLAQRSLGNQRRRVLQPPGGYAILEADR
ncbi:MAG: hypothetical protein ACRD16_15340 [Thermoanaerobaculia bacterium]